MQWEAPGAVIGDERVARLKCFLMYFLSSCRVNKTYEQGEYLNTTHWHESTCSRNFRIIHFPRRTILFYLLTRSGIRFRHFFLILLEKTKKCQTQKCSIL